MNDCKRLVATVAAAVASASVCIATLVEPQWFELLFDSAPDDGDGSLETLVAVAVSAVACVVFSLLARREWHRTHVAPKPASSARH